MWSIKGVTHVQVRLGGEKNRGKEFTATIHALSQSESSVMCNTPGGGYA